MFFPLSKIIWALIAPLNLIFLLLSAGFILLLTRRRRGGGIFIGLALTLFIIAGVLPTGPNMLASLEERYKRPAAMPEWVNNILILGGSFDTAISEARGVPALNSSAERIFEGMGLTEQYPNAVVIFSGGNGRLRPGGRSEADDMADLLSLTGYSDDNVLYEYESRNTFENIQFSRNLFTPMPEETWVVVTSAYHMPRTMAVIKTIRWPGRIIAYPVDYRTTGQTGWLPRRFDVLANFLDTHIALREYAGLLAYQMSGKISYPLNP